MKSLAISFVFAAGMCLGMALPLSRHLDDVEHAMGAVVILCSLAGFCIGGAVALIAMGHPSTLTTDDTEKHGGIL